MSAVNVPAEASNQALVTRSVPGAAMTPGKAINGAAQPPHSIEAEHGVLGSLLLDNSTWSHVVDRLHERDFHVHEHRVIFAMIGKLINAGKPADVITVLEQLKVDGHDACDPAELVALTCSVSSPSNIRRYAEIVRERAVLRKLVDFASDLRAAALARGATSRDVLAQASDMLAQTARTVEPAPARFKLLGAADFHTLPRLVWLIHGVLPATGSASVFGVRGSGKSFLYLDMIAALATGTPWFGYRVPQACRVVVIVLEGEAGFRQRVAAWEKFNERAFPASVRFIFQPFSIMEEVDVVQLAAAIYADGGADVVVIDTLNRAALGADENSSQDMGRIIKGTQMLQTLVGGVVVLVHHAGKEPGKGLRGHSSLAGALDLCIEVARTGERREWRLDKVKDGEDGAVHAFRLQRVDIGADDDGEPIASMVVRAETEAAPAATHIVLPKGGNQRIIYDALGPVLRASAAFGKAGAPALRPCVELEEAVRATRDRLAVEPARRTERTRQAITGLVSSGILGCNEGWIWLR